MSSAADEHQRRVMNALLAGLRAIIPRSFPATASPYDNTASGLTATTTQAAIDELAARSEDGLRWHLIMTGF